jgi:hypothetical protein
MHGLTLAAEYELDATATADAEALGTTDYEVRAGERRPSASRPRRGRMLAALERAERAEWLLERPDGSWLLRYAKTADFEIDRDAGLIVSHLAPDAHEGLAPILLGGSVLAYLSAGPGRLVLHAGAVEIDGRAVALVGASGAGKSTTVAHLCLAGTPLLTDDTLVVCLGEGARRRPVAQRGSRTIRLRPGARRRLAGLEEEAPRTADGRLLLRPASSQRPELELAMVVAVEYVDARAPIAVQRAGGIDAARALLAHPRSPGWRDPGRLREQFDLTARLAGQIPVLRAVLPDRPAAEPLGPELLGTLRSELTSFEP